MNDTAAAPDEGGAARGVTFDPRISLATSVHAAPGTYALLLGAGVSISAGIKTGWGIVQDLVGRAATAQQPADPDAGAKAAEDPEAWWARHGDGEELGYSGLLDQVAPAPGARQAVLRSYFEPKPDEAGEVAALTPGAAHRAIAQLVLRKSVRVILTTNFDRLTERALEEVGISPEIIHDPAQFDSATPLAHTRVTVIKLHGDWTDLHLRNTIDELATYPQAQQEFLERVLDEYGLIVCGWSADWDKALVGALKRTRSRRYPLFWSHLGPLGKNARDLIAKHTATTIAGVSADAFFEDLASRLQALDRMTEPPLSRDMAVARLKRALPDPRRRIELHDLLAENLGRVIAAATPERYPVLLRKASYEDSMRGYRADMDTVMHLVANGVYHDDGTHAGQWTQAIQRLTNLRRSAPPEWNDELEYLRHYPALLAVWCAGVAAILGSREQALHPLLMTPRWTPHFGTDRSPQPAVVYLSPSRLLAGNLINQFDGQNRRYPHSRLIREQAREPLAALEPDDEAYNAACSRLEFLATMLAFDHAIAPYDVATWHGEFLLGRGFNQLSEQISQEIGPGWPLLEAGAFGGDAEIARLTLDSVRDWAAKLPPMF